jgi:pyridoxamine 5'-phosphate oxidase
MKPFAVPNDLYAVFDDAWARIVRGVKDRRSPFHTPVVATVGENGVRQRVMVLRGADPVTGVMRFHTDARSAKIGHIGGGAAASVLGYDPGARIQLSLAGTLALADTAATDAAWEGSALSSRRCYLAQPGPGTAAEGPASGLPETLLDRAPTADESLSGRANFALLLFTVAKIEWLELTSQGNRRASFDLADGTRSAGTWLIP